MFLNKVQKKMNVAEVYSQLSVYKNLCSYYVRVIEVLHAKPPGIQIKLKIFKTLLRFSELRAKSLSESECDSFNHEISVASKYLELYLNSEIDLEQKFKEYVCKNQITPCTSPTFEFIFPIEELD